MIVMGFGGGVVEVVVCVLVDEGFIVFVLVYFNYFGCFDELVNILFEYFCDVMDFLW